MPLPWNSLLCRHTHTPPSSGYSLEVPRPTLLALLCHRPVPLPLPSSTTCLLPPRCGPGLCTECSESWRVGKRRKWTWTMASCLPGLRPRREQDGFRVPLSSLYPSSGPGTCMPSASLRTNTGIPQRVCWHYLREHSLRYHVEARTDSKSPFFSERISFGAGKPWFPSAHDREEGRLVS